MTRIGGQCKGCSFAYWESKRKKRAATSKASSSAYEQSSLDSSSAAPGPDKIKPSIFDDPAGALQDAVKRLTEIESKLNAPNLPGVEMSIETGAPAANEQPPASQVDCDALLEEQQILRTRFNALFRCIGLSESHEKVWNNVKRRYSYRNRGLEEALQASCYFRSLPYYQLLLTLRYKLPGVADLLRFMDVIFSMEVSSLITIYEISSTADANLIRHQFRMGDLTQLLSHWDVLHSCDQVGEANRSVVLVDGLDSVAVEILGDALKIHPLIFARQLWRNSGMDFDNGLWEGPPVSQAPLCSLCSLPNQPFQQVALDVETYISHLAPMRTDMHDVETLRSIDTIGELQNLQSKKLSGQAARIREGEMEKALWGLLHQCGRLELCGAKFEESTRLENPIANCIDFIDGMEDTFKVASVLELCASATVCTLAQRGQERSSTTLVLRTPSRWHMSGDATLTQDPFRQQVSSQNSNVGPSSSIREALHKVRDLEAAAGTNVSQKEISELVSLSLLRAAMSNLWNMTVLDHQILVNPDTSYTLKKDKYSSELVAITDGSAEYLSGRCQRRRDAMRLASGEAGHIEATIAEIPGDAFRIHLQQELGFIHRTVAKIDLQLQQTEKQLTVRIDQSFRDLQIKLAQTQLEESRKAIKQADTVARLTILAFIFIPVGAVCGFFGMNIVEVAAGGGFPWWVFGTTIGVVLAMTLFLAFADSLYALWCYYAGKADFRMIMDWHFSYWLLSDKVPYVFRWLSVKVRAKIASGRRTRQFWKERTNKAVRAQEV